MYYACNHPFRPASYIWKYIIYACRANKGYIGEYIYFSVSEVMNPDEPCSSVMHGVLAQSPFRARA